MQSVARKPIGIIALLLLVLSASLSWMGCGGGDKTNTITLPAANVAPIASAGAGAGQSVTVGATVTLDGSLSVDANGDRLTYAWTLTSRPSGSSAALSSATAVKPSFTADVSGSYVASLVVNDGKVNSNSASVTISAAMANVAPVASAGAAQSVVTGSTVTLDGSASTDANGDALTYAWTLNAPSGSSARLSSATAVRPSFTTDVSGTYVATLTVNDGELNSAAATVTLTAAVLNVAPVAKAGSPQNVVTGSAVILDGRDSSDANGDSLGYLWSLTSLPTGSSAALSSASTAKPTFTADKDGTYVIQLIVSDGRLNSAPDTVTITAATANSIPVASAGNAQSVATGAAVALDGSASSDANGDTLTYAWTLIVPSGSSATLSNAAAVKPSFTADVSGVYTAVLYVNDGALNSAPATVVVLATPANVAPVASAGAGQSVPVGATVTLDGSASTDANGDRLTYAWTLTSRPSGSSAALSSATAVKPSFTADVSGSYVASLVVNDGKVNSNSISVTISAAMANVAPTASAGSNQNVVTGSSVTLDGSASTDANGDALTYAWTLNAPSGSSATLSSATAVKPSFTADISGSYVATLTVNDGQVNSTAATVTLTAAVLNVAPVAKAGSPQNVVTGSAVILDGRDSSDANGDSLGYLWSLTSLPTGSSAALSSASTAKPTFTTDKDGTYVIQLIVSDGRLNSAPDTVTITAATANSMPVASAGNAQSVATGAAVALDGSASSDANGDTLSYAWTLISIPSSSNATLSGSTVQKPTFTADKDGAYVAQLIVNDGKVNSAVATVVITAATSNAAPVAKAGSDQSVATGSAVTLDGSGSSDANNDTLTYLWSFRSIPNGSTATLSSSTAQKPGFTTDKDGTYVAQLIVNDGKVNSAVATVVITATAAITNTAPVANAGSNQVAHSGSTITLDGSGSTDADGDTLTYLWVLTSKPSGSAAVFLNVTAQKPTFTADKVGSYVAQLVVSDGKLTSTNIATVTITFAQFVKLDATGAALDASATSWSGVADNVNNLAWEVKNTTDSSNLRYYMNIYTNYDSTSEPQLDGTNAPTQAQIDASTNSVGFKNAVNAAGLCGATDWRLPTEDELSALVDAYGFYAYFADTENYTWTSSSFPSYPSRCMMVYFAYGGTHQGVLRSNRHLVRLVRTMP